MTDRAPFHDDVADGPPGGHAVWARAADGVRVRVGLWPVDGARGTVLLFPGRTEYVEKYGRAAGDLTRRGYAVAAIDWRGQGLADRLLPGTPLRGHVGRFADYYLDARAMVGVVRAAGLPAPHHLLAHSLGGGIGLGALHHGLKVNSAVFSSPMWGISMPRLMRPVAWTLSHGGHHARQGHRVVPGTDPDGSYVMTAAFEDNNLTNDPDMWAYMRRQGQAYPELTLGGPSLTWLAEALAHCRRMRRRPAPSVPALTWLGTDERVVHSGAIIERMADWPGGRLEMIEGARHEPMMDTPAVRARVFDGSVAHFDANA